MPISYILLTGLQWQEFIQDQKEHTLLPCQGAMKMTLTLEIASPTQGREVVTSKAPRLTPRLVTKLKSVIIKNRAFKCETLCCRTFGQLLSQRTRLCHEVTTLWSSQLRLATLWEWFEVTSFGVSLHLRMDTDTMVVMLHFLFWFCSGVTIKH